MVCASSVNAVGSNQRQVVFCSGVNGLNRGHEAVFLTQQLDTWREVGLRKAELIRDDSNGYTRSRLFLEAHLRQMPLIDTRPHFYDMGAFTPMEPQKERSVFHGLNSPFGEMPER